MFTGPFFFEMHVWEISADWVDLEKRECVVECITSTTSGIHVFAARS